MIAMIILIVSVARGTNPLDGLILEKEIPLVQIPFTAKNVDISEIGLEIKLVKRPLKKPHQHHPSIRKETACLPEQQKFGDIMSKENHKWPNKTKGHRYFGRKGRR